MLPRNEIKSIQRTIWVSRIVRWALGSLFIAVGIIYFNYDGWPAILFGTVMLITGFFRPRRCIGESCDIIAISKKTTENL